MDYWVEWGSRKDMIPEYNTDPAPDSFIDKPPRIERMRYGEDDYGVRITYPDKRDIPQSNLVASVLNTALMARFQLRICFNVEGGVEGLYKGAYVDLRNLEDNLGLFVGETSEYYLQSRGLHEVLDFYEKMVRLLFEQSFQIGKKIYPRGAILLLPKSENDGVGQDEVWKVLIAMLTKVRSRKFARQVATKFVNESSNPFGGRYLTGLTNEEIVKFFVPPPYFKTPQ